MNPHIKILVLNWNGMGVIENCLKSISKINYTNYSVCIIDNNSKDGSVNFIENNFKFYELIKNKSNLGYSKGYNIAFDEFKNNNSIDYFFILNNDTIISDSNILNDLVLNANNFGTNNIYSPLIFNSEGRIWFAGGKVNKFLGYTKHIGLNKNSKLGTYKTRKTDYISGCSMFISKKNIDNLKGFNTKYDMYYEDVDLCFRAKKINLDCYVIDSTFIQHNVSHSFKGFFKFKKMFKKFISMNKFIFSNNNLIISILILLYHLIMIPIYFVLYIVIIILR